VLNDAPRTDTRHSAGAGSFVYRAKHHHGQRGVFGMGDPHAARFAADVYTLFGYSDRAHFSETEKVAM